jgi:type III secretory pathway lipoprotein EscJ
MKDWEKIYIAGQLHQAEIVKAVLEDHEIEASIIDKRDSSYLFGDAEVYVQQKDVAEARRIITENQL